MSYSLVKLVAVILARVESLRDFGLLGSGQRTVHREKLVILLVLAHPRLAQYR